MKTINQFEYVNKINDKVIKLLADCRNLRNELDGLYPDTEDYLTKYTELNEKMAVVDALNEVVNDFLEKYFIDNRKDSEGDE